MRISNAMMAANIKASLFKQNGQMYKTQEMIVSGKRINRPSDDPIGMSSVMGYRSSISSLDQYSENISQAKIRIDTAENALEIVTELLRDAKNIAFDPDPDMRLNLAQDVASIRDQVLQISNYQLNGEYLFAGDLTDTAPFDAAGVYNGDNGNAEYMIGENAQVDIAADGSAIFQGASDIFAVLDTLETELIAGNPTGITNQITPLENAIDNINTIRAQNAGDYKRLEATENHYAYFKLNMQELMSRTEDADLAAAIVDFQAQQTAYESTLATSSMIMQKSLIDFIR
ncbi:MAG: flagellar hook-associated protein FlgL [Desulfobacteraceae bacterium]|jgi:flagellar hook-associated protein 3 FlgL